jgi:hypothetical protein
MGSEWVYSITEVDPDRLTDALRKTKEVKKMNDGEVVFLLLVVERSL